MLSWARSQVSGLWLGKIMKAGVEWLLTTATNRAELRARIMTERAAILLRTFNYLGDGRRVTSVIETYICTKQKIMSIMCLLSVWESQLCLLKNVLKSCLYNNEVHCQHGQLVNSTLPPRHCYWVTRVVSVTCLLLSRHVSWHRRAKSHPNNMILSGNLCLDVVSGWHWMVLCVVVNQEDPDYGQVAN